MKDAEADASTRIDQLKQAIATEEYRLSQAQQATAAYLAKVKAFHDQEVAFLAGLDQLVPPDNAPEEDTTQEIEASVSAAIHGEAEPEQVQVDEPTVVVEASQPPVDDLDPDATRRFEDLQFGKDYEIT